MKIHRQEPEDKRPGQAGSNAKRPSSHTKETAGKKQSSKAVAVKQGSSHKTHIKPALKVRRDPSPSPEPVASSADSQSDGDSDSDGYDSDGSENDGSGSDGSESDGEECVDNEEPEPTPPPPPSKKKHKKRSDT